MIVFTSQICCNVLSFYFILPEFFPLDSIFCPRFPESDSMANPMKECCDDYEYLQGNTINVHQDH